MHSFEMHSNESTCRKIGRIGLEQVYVDHQMSSLVIAYRGANIGIDNRRGQTLAQDGDL